jgi:hypothetical protein
MFKLTSVLDSRISLTSLPSSQEASGSLARREQPSVIAQDYIPYYLAPGLEDIAIDMTQPLILLAEDDEIDTPRRRPDGDSWFNETT